MTDVDAPEDRKHTAGRARPAVPAGFPQSLPAIRGLQSSVVLYGSLLCDDCSRGLFTGLFTD